MLFHALVALLALTAPKYFVQIAPPSGAQLNAARFGTRSWHLRFAGNDLRLSAPTPKPQLPFSPAIDTAAMGSYGPEPTQALHAHGAWFLAYNHGEFGGALWQFNENGSVGRMLLANPVYDLTPYKGMVLAATGAASPFFFKPLRIHEFARRADVWTEIAHVDFPYNIFALRNFRSQLYGIEQPAYQQIALVNIDLSGNIVRVWTSSGNFDISDLAMSQDGDFAISMPGYILRLRKHDGAYTPIWYAPRDCVARAIALNDPQGLNARCIGAPGTRSYAHKHLAPASRVSVSSDGNWMLPCCGQELLHYSGGVWNHVALPHDPDVYLNRIENLGNDVFIPAKSLWLRRSGRWSQIGVAEDICGPTPALTPAVVWCVMRTNERAWITGYRIDGGKTITIEATAAKPQFIYPGLANDAWLTEEGRPYIAHATEAGALQELPLKSAVQSLSTGERGVWFTETDLSHYGFIDGAGTVHEMAWTGDPGGSVLSIQAARAGGWLRQSFSNSRVLLRHVSEAGVGDHLYVTNVGTSIVAPDGAVWAQSANWPTVIRLSENGTMKRYLLPCFQPGLRLLHAPNNGVWFLSQEPHCSGLIDVNAIHVRDLPLVQQTDYQ